ncbi:Panacea domain-containing protein [Roseibium sp. MB-4]
MREKFNHDKFKALVHYIIWKAGAHDGFGATKLNKVLWFADARAFSLNGHSLTGAKYIRQKYGPVPHQIMPVRQELVNEGAMSQWQDKPYGESGSVAWRFKAISPPNINVFTSDEVKLVDWWIDYIDGKTATEISDESHDYGWEIARMGEELPFHAFLASRIREEPSSEAMEWARNRAKELGLL